MPSKSVKRLPVFDNEGLNSNCPIKICDVVVVVVLLLVVLFTAKSVFTQISAEDLRLQEESIICIKEFDSRGCNPFNMTSVCQEKLECIKSGDGLNLTGVLEIISKHIKNNGAFPSIMIMLAIANEIRRRTGG